MKLDLEFQDDVPEGWTPLEAVVVIKCLSGDGSVALHETATPSVNGWEAAGMLLWALDGTRDDLRNASETP